MAGRWNKVREIEVKSVAAASSGYKPGDGAAMEPKQQQQQQQQQKQQKQEPKHGSLVSLIKEGIDIEVTTVAVAADLAATADLATEAASVEYTG